ncbi:hypothetical protein [Streptomyces sp. NPDC001820]
MVRRSVDKEVHLRSDRQEVDSPNREYFEREPPVFKSYGLGSASELGL